MARATFFRVRAAQEFEAFEFWERFFATHAVSRIIELGTYRWGMSLYLYLWSLTNGAAFYTFDHKRFPAPRIVDTLGVPDHFRQADVFAIEAEIGALAQSFGTTLLFCDGGDKPRELATFAKYLKPGDYIATHDYGTEVAPTQVPAGLTRVAQGALTAIFHA